MLLVLFISFYFPLCSTHLFIAIPVHCFPQFYSYSCVASGRQQHGNSNKQHVAQQGSCMGPKTTPFRHLPWLELIPTKKSRAHTPLSLDPTSNSRPNSFIACACDLIYQLPHLLICIFYF